MTTEYTQAQVDEAEAAFERAYAASDISAMKEIYESRPFQKGMVDRAGEAVKQVIVDGEADRKIIAKVTLAIFVNMQSRVAVMKMQRARSNAIEARIAELEKTPFAYDGPHESGKAYRKGTFVTHGGGLWHCNYTTASRPGDGPAWTLAVKHGRDLR